MKRIHTLISAILLIIVMITSLPSAENAFGQTEIFSMNLTPGINLISVPLDPGDEWRMSDLLAFIGPEALQIIYYDTINSQFKSYLPSYDIDAPLNASVRGGEGYIVFMKSAKTVTFDGKAWDGTVSLQQGINMISVPLDPGDKWRLSDLLAFIGPEALQIIYYDTINSQFRSYLPSYDVDAPLNISIRGGEGYILIMSAPKTVTFKGNAWQTVSEHYNVGFQTLKVPRSGEEPLVIAVWYPTNEAVASPPMKYVLIEQELEADVAPDALPLKGPFPLVIVSHGGGICATTMAIYAEELASSGFIVAGPDHSDEFTACCSDGSKLDVTVEDWLKWVYKSSAEMALGIPQPVRHRPVEITTTIDTLLELNADQTSPFYGVVDSENIGMMGVSFGAWTTSVVSGAIPFFHDKRIKAAIPIVGTPGRTDLSLLEIPVMMIFGEEETMILIDPESPKKTEGMKEQYELINPPKFLIGVKGVGHFDFGGAGAFNPIVDGDFSTRDIRLKDDVTGVVNKYCIAFFKRYLMGDYTTEKTLTESDPRLFLFKADLGVK